MWLSAILYVLVFVLVCVQLYKYVTYKPDKFPPGPIRLPLWGSYLFCLLENFNFPQVTLLRWAKKYGSIYGMYLGDFPTVIVSDNETCKEVLKRIEFDGRPELFALRLRTVGQQRLGIFSTEGPQWHEQRRFSLRHMRDYGLGRRYEKCERMMAEQIQSLVNFMKYAKYSPKDSDIIRTDGCFLLPDILYPIMLNAIMSVFDMEPALPDTDRYRSFRKIGRSAMDLQHGMHPTGALSLVPWIRYLLPETSGYNKLTASNKVLFPFFKSVIEEIKQTRVNDEVRNFNDRYFDKMRANENEEYSTFSDDQLLMLTIDYMFPAVTSVTAVIVQVIYSLLHHPECQDKMQKEIDEVVGRGRLPTVPDKKYMPYTESVIREVLRKETLIPLGIPHRVTEDTTLRGYSIPRNTVVYTLLQGAHMDEKVWGDPENFRPERFISNTGTLVKKDFSIPFGAGKRVCAGETAARNSLFLIVAALYQNFTFKLPNDAKLPKLENKVPGVVNTQKDLCWVHAVARN